MSDSVLYNQEVTAEILNDIAIDLGNTSFNGFGEEKFGADALNDITASLVTKGVLMSGNQCKPIVSGENVCIQTGTIVFENGAKKKITEVINVPLQNGIYIYALNDVAAGTCEIISSGNDPATDTAVSGQDYIEIAEIDADGSLTDKRTFSSAKVVIPTENQYYSQKFTVKVSQDESMELVGTYELPLPFKVGLIQVSGSQDRCVYLEDGVMSKGVYVDLGNDFMVWMLRNGTTLEIYGESWRQTISFTFTVDFA